MSSSNWDDIDNFEEEEYFDEDFFESEKDAIVFIIEATDSFYTKWAKPLTYETGFESREHKHALMYLLEIITRFLFRRLIDSKQGLAGIIIVNGSYKDIKTEDEKESKSQNEYSEVSSQDGCHLFMDLSVPSIDKLKHLKLMSVSNEEFSKYFTPTTDSSTGLANAFYLANKLLTSQKNTKTKTYNSKRVVFITDRDTPLDFQAQKLAIKTRVKDLVQQDVELIPYFINPISETEIKQEYSEYLDEKSAFNIAKFYEDILFLSMTKEIDPSLLIPKNLFEIDLLKDKQFKYLQATKRALFSSVLQLSDNIQIGIKGYNLIQKSKVPQPSTICATYIKKITKKDDEKDTEAHEEEYCDNRELVVRKRIALSLETGNTVNQSDIIRSIRIGDQLIPCTPEQVESLKKLPETIFPCSPETGKPKSIFKLVGFKDASAISWHYNLTKSVFLYPSDSTLVNSKRAFTALYKSLIKKNKVAIVWAVPRSNSTPVMGALMPYPSDESEVEILKQHYLSTIPRRDDESSGNNDKKRYSANDSKSVYPMGLYFVPLPFADDIRDKPVKKLYKELDFIIRDDTTSEQVTGREALTNRMGQIIERLFMKAGYEPKRYPNPQLRNFYKVFEQSVFEEEYNEEEADLFSMTKTTTGEQKISIDMKSLLRLQKLDPTLPKYTSIYSRAGEEIEKWNELLQSVVLTTQESVPALPVDAVKKRKRGGDESSSTDASAAKSSKRTKQDIMYAQKHELFTVFQSLQTLPGPIKARYQDYTEDDLRSFITHVGIKTKAVKRSGLEAAITKYFDSL